MTAKNAPYPACHRDYFSAKAKGQVAGWLRRVTQPPHIAGPLAIEIDGEIHLKNEVMEYDDGRRHDIEKFGIKILRFTNNEVFTDMKKIIEEILKTIAALEPPLGRG